MTADAKLEVVLSAKNLAKKGFDDFEQQAKKAAKGVTGSFSVIETAIKNTIGGFALGAAATAWVREIDKAGAAYFQMSQTFQTRTALMVKEAEDMAADFKHFYNFSDIAYAFTKTADSMERYGVTGQKYIDLVARAAEIGAAKNLELKESIDRIESAIRGEAEASEYLGLTLNDTYMKNNALGGSLKGTWEKLSDNEKALHRYNELMSQSGKYAGSTAEAINTLGGAWNRFTNSALDSANGGLRQQNGLLAQGLNYLSDYIDLFARVRDSWVKNDALKALSEERFGARSHKIGTDTAGYSDFLDSFKKPVSTTAASGGSKPGKTAKGPTGPSGSRLDYFAYQGAQVDPDWFMGMADAGERAKSIMGEAQAAATISFADMSVSEQTWLDGARAGLEEYNSYATDTFQNTADLFGASMGSMEDFLVDFVTTGKLEFKDLVNSILEDMARLVIRQNITGPLSSLLSAGLSSAFGGGGGGIHAGMDAAGNSTAFHFAGGGIASGPLSGYGATLHGTEAIVPLSGGRSIPVEMRGGGDMEVNIHNYGDKTVTAKQTHTGDGKRQLMIEIGNDIRSMGPVGQAIGSRFGMPARGIA